MNDTKEEVSPEAIDNILQQLNSAENDVLRMMEIFSSSAGIMASAPLESAQNMRPLIEEYHQLRSELHKKVMDSSQVLLLTPKVVESSGEYLEAVEKGSDTNSSK